MTNQEAIWKIKEMREDCERKLKDTKISPDWRQAIEGEVSAIDNAISALKKQKAMKPDGIIRGPYKITGWCPVCGTGVKGKHFYCHGCGQN